MAKEPITDLSKFLKENANAIREAKGSNEQINAQNFSNEIRNLKKINLEPLAVTQNGTYVAPEGSAYSQVEVNVPSESTLKKLLDATKKCSYLFYTYSGTNIDELISYEDTSNVIAMSNMFYKCPNLTTIPPLDTSNVESMSYMFNGCSSLKSILMYGMKVSFDISVSTQFEREDLVIILNNLATVTSTKTLTMGTTNLAKLTDEDKEIAIAKGWTLA